MSQTNYTGSYLIAHFFIAYAFTNSRPLKVKWGIDHQVSPREDLIKYGAKAVSDGKITQDQLNMLKRIESAHANSVENFPLFASALLLANIAGVPTQTINNSALAYTVLRVVYYFLYRSATTRRVALWRAPTWWIANFVCVRLFWLSHTAMNRKVL